MNGGCNSDMRNPKGSVSVSVQRGRIRIRLPRTLFSDKKQRYVSLNLSDTPENKKFAEFKARQIEFDILSGNFDISLEKYLAGDYQASTVAKQLTFDEIYERYIASKNKVTSPSTQKGYLASLRILQRTPFKLLAEAVKFSDWALENLPTDTAKRLFVQINAACNWAVERSIIDRNPFLKINTKVRKPKSKKKIYPFSLKEEEAIILGFQSSETYCDLTPIIRFFFLTGCRTSEALGLQWQHISIDLSLINFKETVVIGRGGTFRNDKTKSTERYFPCNDQLKKLLLSIRPNNYQSGDSVFTRTDGSPITHSEIRNAWYGKGDKLGIVRSLANEKVIEAYRVQYNTRHTFITRCLEAGVSPVQIAQWVGNSPAMIYRHYAGVISKVSVPEF